MKKDKKFLIANIVVAILVFMVFKEIGIFTADDFYLYKYYTEEFSFSQFCEDFEVRIINWNARLGEVLYLILWRFPLIVYAILGTFIVLLFFNLILYYIFGRQKLKENKNKWAYLGIIYIAFAFLLISFQNIFLWIGGLLNHLLSVVLCMIILIPYRDMLDGKEFDIKGKKYIAYLILCFISGFGVETTVPVAIVAMFIANLYLLKKNKKINVRTLLPMILHGFGFLILLSLTVRRYKIQAGGPLIGGEKEDWFNKIFITRKLNFIILAVEMVIYFLIYKLKNKKELKNIGIIFAISFVNLIAVIFSPYLYQRVILLFDIILIMVILYFLFKIIDAIKNEKIIIGLGIVVYTFFAYYNVCLAIVLQDYSEFAIARGNNMVEQSKSISIEEEVIYYHYDGKKNTSIFSKKFNEFMLEYEYNEFLEGLILQRYKVANKPRFEANLEFDIR